MSRNDVDKNSGKFRTDYVDPDRFEFTTGRSGFKSLEFLQSRYQPQRFKSNISRRPINNPSCDTSAVSRPRTTSSTESRSIDSSRWTGPREIFFVRRDSSFRSRRTNGNKNDTDERDATTLCQRANTRPRTGLIKANLSLVFFPSSFFLSFFPFFLFQRACAFFSLFSCPRSDGSRRVNGLFEKPTGRNRGRRRANEPCIFQPPPKPHSSVGLGSLNPWHGARGPPPLVQGINDASDGSNPIF